MVEGRCEMSYDFIIRSPEATYEIYERNVTYNNSSMLKRAGFHPYVLEGCNVKRLIPVVSNSIEILKDHPTYFKQFEPAIDPATGVPWGGYEDVLQFLDSMLTYLLDAPDEYVLVVV